MHSASPKQRIRIAYCIDSFAVGGTELNAVRTAESLDSSRFELAVFHFQQTGSLRARYETLGVKLHYMPISSLYSFATAAQGMRFSRFLREWRADVVHTHDLYTNIFAVPWARLSGATRIIASRRWWFDAPRPGLNVLNRWCYRLADRVLANSAGVAKLLVGSERVPFRKIVTVPNFLTEAAFARVDARACSAMRASWRLPGDAFVVGIVARLAPVKNHDMLLRAAALCDPAVHVIVIGDGPSRDELIALSRQLDIESRVHFVGEILSDKNLHQYFDVSVLCSTSEGFPNSIIEAMAAARPVVATEVGGITDVVIDRETGRLVSSGDVKQLVAAIEQLRLDANLRQELGVNGQQFVSARFHEKAVMGQLSDLYTALANETRGRRYRHPSWRRT